MNLLILFIAICAFVVLYNLVFLIFRMDDREAIDKRLSKLYSEKAVSDVRGEILKEKKDQNKKTLGLKMVSDKLEEDLVTAGISISGEEFLRLWVMVAVLPPFVLLILGQSAVTALAVGVICLILPPALVNSEKKKKAALFDKQLGDALLIMSNSLRAGYTFPQAMESIAKDTQPPLADEFKIVLREMDIGVPMEDALKHMAARTQNDDVRILVSAVLISSQVGANLADVLDNISGTIKSRLELKDQIQVLTAQGRMSGLIVGALPIVMFLMLMIINPTYILSFIETSLGIGMLGVGVVMEVLGFIVINRIVDIKY